MTYDLKALPLAIGAVAVILSGRIAAAAEPVFLAPQAATARIADGLPWSARATNGRTFKLTLTKDGAGAINGPLNFKLSLKWTIKGDAVCLSGAIISKCLRFQEISGGVQGWNGDAQDLRLTR